jgi:hypothetical protein
MNEKNKVIKEIESLVLEEVTNWWEVERLEMTEDGYVKEVVMDVPEMNLIARIVFPCGATNFHYLLQADFIDEFDGYGWEDAAIDCWYEDLDDLLPDIKSTKVHEKIYDYYEKKYEEDV